MGGGRSRKANRVRGLAVCGTVAALVLAMCVLLGSSIRSTKLSNVWLFKFNVNTLDKSHVENESTTMTNLTGRRELWAQNNGFYTTYRLGVAGATVQMYQQDETTELIYSKELETVGCKNLPMPFFWTWVEIVNRVNSINENSDIPRPPYTNTPEDIATHSAKLARLQRATSVMYFMGIAFLSVALLSGIIAIFYNKLVVSACATSAIAFLLILVSNCMLTGIYSAYFDLFHGYMEVEIGDTALGLMWTAAIASLWAMGWWIAAILHSRYLRHLKGFY